MTHKIEKQEDNKVLVTMTIPAADVEVGMRAAAERLSKTTEIKGFRPGKATYDVIEQRFGKMKLIEEAAEELVRNAFVKAMLEEDLDTVGQPYFNVEKMAPGNDMIVTAEIALYPKVESIADYNKLSVEKKDVEPSKEMIDQAKKDLVAMQTKEIRRGKDEKLEKGDKAVVELTMKRDGVVLDGGHTQNHAIFTAEPYYIDGFVEKIIGAKEGEERAFTLSFPKDHYQKPLAGSDVDFTVKIEEIFRLEAPAIDDAFAKTVGLKDAKELEEKLKENLKLENIQEESTRQEKKMLDLLAEKSQFETLPDLLVNQEIEKMIHELKHNISSRGLEFEDYLKSINKGLAELKLDLTPTAIRRIEVSILIKEIAKKEEISVEDKEVDAELDKMAKQYEGNKEATERLYSPQYRDYVTHQLRNMKTVDFLKEKMVK